MNKKHLFWIVPVSFVIGFVVSLFLGATGDALFYAKYPVVGCIAYSELSMNPDNNGMFIDPESLREHIARRCVETTIDFNSTLEIVES